MNTLRAGVPVEEAPEWQIYRWADYLVGALHFVHVDGEVKNGTAFFHFRDRFETPVIGVYLRNTVYNAGQCKFLVCYGVGRTEDFSCGRIGEMVKIVAECLARYAREIEQELKDQCL